MSENNQAAKSPQAPIAGFGGKGLNIGIAVSAAVAVVGLVLWGLQLMGGFMDSGMRDFAPWGMSIASFMLFVGLSVGSMIIAALPKAFGIEGFGPIAKVTAWISICCTVVAIAFVVVDLGQPLRLWELFAYSNLTSPLMWDIIVLSLYLILSAVFLWTLLRAEAGKASEKAVRIMSVVAMVCAVAVCIVDAWIFGLMPAREMWFTALLAPWFVASALASGTALVVIALLALEKAGFVGVGEKDFGKLVKLMGIFVVVDLLFFACDLVTDAFAPAGGAVASMLLAGPLAPLFWAQVIACVAAAVICFVPNLRTAPLTLVAAVLVVAGIFFKRIQLVAGGFQIPALDYQTFITDFTVTGDWGAGLTGAYSGMIYAPTLTDLGLVLGVIALGVLLVLVGLKRLPLNSTEGTR